MDTNPIRRRIQARKPRIGPFVSIRVHSWSKNSEAWMARTPIVGALVGVGDRQQFGLAEGLADQLEADRQASRRETAGHADAGQAGEVHADRVDVAEIE